MGQSKCFAILSAVLGTIVINATAQGEWVLSIYGGKSITENGDLELHQRDSTGLIFEDVSWDDRSFESPLYYGARPSYWLDKWPGWGASLDFTHAKMYLDPNDTVHVIGTRLGMAVSEPERIGATIQRFNNSHGLNFLTLNLLHRWFPKGQRDDSPLGRLQPYVGMGAGITSLTSKPRWTINPLMNISSAARHCRDWLGSITIFSNTSPPSMKGRIIEIWADVALTKNNGALSYGPLMAKTTVNS